MTELPPDLKALLLLRVHSLNEEEESTPAYPGPSMRRTNLAPTLDKWSYGGRRKVVRSAPAGACTRKPKAEERNWHMLTVQSSMETGSAPQ